MEIRAATAADVPDVLPMVAKICALHESFDPARYGNIKDPQEMYRPWLTARASDPRAVFLVADRSPGLMAFLIGAVETDVPIYRLQQYGFIHDIWVEEAYRHEGIARQMVMLAVERFRAIGMTQVRLATAAANVPAQDLFKSCGFRPSTTEMLLEM